MVFTETLLRDASEGLRMAKRVQEITGAPLPNIMFWEHAFDERLEKHQLQYRLMFMHHLFETLM